MRFCYLILFSLLSATTVSAQGVWRPDFCFSIGDGSLYTPRSEKLSPSFNIAGHANYIEGVFMLDIGFGAALISDNRPTYYTGYGSRVTSESVFFAEIPAGFAFRIPAGKTDVIVGTDVSLLCALNYPSFFTQLSPHIDILTRNKRGSNNGPFLKAMINIGGDNRFFPSYYGVGYKVMYPPNKKKTHKKSTPRATTPM